jgi:hypothetical protein
LRNLLKRLGVENPDVEEWEAKPSARRSGEVPKKPKKLVQDQAEVQAKPEAKAADAAAVKTLRPPSPAEVLAALDKATRHVLKAGVPREQLVEALIERTIHLLGRDPAEAGLRDIVLAMVNKTRLGRP